MIASAVEAELEGYMSQFRVERTATGHAAVVRNVPHPERPVETGTRPVSVRIPKVRSNDGTPVTFNSALGLNAKGLSVDTVSRLKRVWAKEYENWRKGLQFVHQNLRTQVSQGRAILQKDHEVLMAFFDFPTQHWMSIRTSNPIEPAFATIMQGTKRSKGFLSRDGMLHMMFKLGQCAEDNWRRLHCFDYFTKVITGAKFKDRIETTQEDQVAA